MSSETEQKPKYIRKKCEHGKQPYYCLDCGGKGLCIHKKAKSSCKDCGGGSALCPHGSYKQHCRKEGCGASICGHGHRRSRCPQCKGGSVCEHGKLKTRCKDCYEEKNENKEKSELCEHLIRKEQCNKCMGSAICAHKKRRSRCIECNGSEICEHKSNKHSCVECNGKHICEHYKVRNQCITCEGSKICPHKKRINICIECGGSSMCQHDKQRYACTTCTPENACHHCKSVSILGSRWTPYCFRCFCVLHPDAEIPRRFKLKEHYVRDQIKDHFKDTLTLTFDKSIEGGCSKKRPDILIDFGSHCIIIEIDENCHVNYTCEQSRMVSLYEDTGFRNIVFLRFNPDGYILNHKRYPSPFRYTPTGMLSLHKEEMDKRMKSLIQSIEYHQGNQPMQPITIEYLFYGDPPAEATL